MKSVCGIYLPDGDTHFAAHLENGPRFNGRGTYQFAKIERALQIVSGRRLALDIGAHVGLWSRVLAGNFDRVIAFEPVPEHIICFSHNLADCPNVTLHQSALGVEEGVLHLDPVADNSGNAHVSETGSVAAQVATLDNFAFTGVDLIKIDAEGFEDFIVRGGEETIRRERPAMVVEQKPGHAERYGLTQTAAVETLQSWGAEIAWVMAGDYGLIWRSAS